jgi:hypothetical protein
VKSERHNTGDAARLGRDRGDHELHEHLEPVVMLAAGIGREEGHGHLA